MHVFFKSLLVSGILYSSIAMAADTLTNAQLLSDSIKRRTADISVTSPDKKKFSTQISDYINKQYAFGTANTNGFKNLYLKLSSDSQTLSICMITPDYFLKPSEGWLDKIMDMGFKTASSVCSGTQASGYLLEKKINYTDILYPTVIPTIFDTSISNTITPAKFRPTITLSSSQSMVSKNIGLTQDLVDTFQGSCLDSTSLPEKVLPIVSTKCAENANNVGTITVVKSFSLVKNQIGGIFNKSGCDYLAKTANCVVQLSKSNVTQKGYYLEPLVWNEQYTVSMDVGSFVIIPDDPVSVKMMLGLSIR